MPLRPKGRHTKTKMKGHSAHQGALRNLMTPERNRKPRTKYKHPDIFMAEPLADKITAGRRNSKKPQKFR